MKRGGDGGGELGCGVRMLSHQHIHGDSEPASHLVILNVDHTDHRVPNPMTAKHPGMAE